MARCLHYRAARLVRLKTRRAEIVAKIARLERLRMRQERKATNV